MAFLSRTQSFGPRGSPWLADMLDIAQAPLGGINMQDYRANSLSAPFKFREALKTGRVMIGSGLSIASLAVARIQATLNFDFMFVDAEHTPIGPDLLQDIVKTLNYHSEGQTATIVRLPTHGHEWAAWALDAGASGVVFPHTDDVEQAKAAVKHSRFMPYGSRSYPPFATIPGHTDGADDGKTMIDVYNDHAAVILQIESVAGVKNIEEIVQVPGVDAIMIGTADLRMDMGLQAGMVGPEPEFNEALDKITRVCAQYNKPILSFATGPLFQDRLNRGWKLLMCHVDALAMVMHQTARLKELRGVVAAHEKALDEPANGHANGVANGHA